MNFWYQKVGGGMLSVTYRLFRKMRNEEMKFMNANIQVKKINFFSSFFKILHSKRLPEKTERERERERERETQREREREREREKQRERACSSVNHKKDNQQNKILHSCTLS